MLSSLLIELKPFNIVFRYMIKEKERILLVNKFYYPRGGDCMVTLNLEKLLKSKGHDVAIFSMQHSQNIESQYTPYFPKEISFSGSIKNKINAAKRIFGIDTIKTKFDQLLSDFRPDIVHLHNIHSYLSPIVAEQAKAYGCKVFWTMHDYKLLCPASACLNKNQICQQCLSDKKQVFINKCLKNSLIASLLGYIESIYWSKEKLEQWTEAFICPSQFMADMMIKGGYSPNKIKIRCNFIEKEKIDFIKHNFSNKRNDYYCFIGRISQEKLNKTLLKIANELPYNLIIEGNGPLLETLKRKYASKKIIFTGHLSTQEVADLLGKARASIIPSECYDNNPLSIIESLCMGTPVIGSRIGGIPELITENNGILFEPFDKDELKGSIIELFENKKFDYIQISQTAINQFSEENYYTRLCNIYRQII